MTAASSRSTIRWQGLALTIGAALSTYYLRTALGLVGLQAVSFLVPVLVAAYFFGSRLAVLAAVLSIGMAHAILWTENPAVLFTRGYFIGILNFWVFAAVIILYAYRHEQVLQRLDTSLAREKAAREEAEEANRLKDQFLATLSHELRTPINVILGYLQMLLADRTNDPRKALEIVHRNAEEQARLIEDVLDVSRISTGTLQITPELVRPVALLRDSIESLQPAIAAKGLHLSLQTMGDQDAPILADPHRLRQVFWNILSNAVKFTPPGGRVMVHADVQGPHVEISVTDTGRGIAREFLPHVFDLFRQGDPSMTREATGMGVGLNLVKRFVEMQGGEVAIHSAGVGHGATITCRFPIYRPASGASAAAPTPLFGPAVADGPSESS